jgi:hypothetical protein
MASGTSAHLPASVIDIDIVFLQRIANADARLCVKLGALRA